MSAALGNEIISCLGKEIPKYDLVITGDFGHGFINSGIRRKIEEKSKFLALNVQTNSSNFGHHPFTLYRKFDFLSMNMQELALALHEEHKDAKEMIRKCCKKLKINNFLVTLGKNGCTYVKNGIMINAPILTSSVKDTVGAGDAVFSVISLFVYLNAEKELIPFIASCAGGIGVNIMGNKESITKKKLLDFIKKTLKEK
ncbi:MAG: PfkB family carbohydrate kinase [Candidatus Woesearchaeota archaeon]|nr:PfkB family carbohydrate kinase [Candidatus Woesearchaeota archaeon]